MQLSISQISTGNEGVTHSFVNDKKSNEVFTFKLHKKSENK